jgi:hypothetical protein
MVFYFHAKEFDASLRPPQMQFGLSPNLYCQRANLFSEHTMQFCVLPN